MATLEVSINCLCLFVPDPAEGIVHVLMPAMHGHHSHGADRHVVRVIHPKRFPGKGKSMEGWVLELGSGRGPAETSLRPRIPPKNGDDIVDLTSLAGSLDPALIEDPRALLSRVELRAGRVKELRADAIWEINGRRIATAHRLTWEIEDITDEQVAWRPLGASNGDPPFRSLAEFGTGGDVIGFEIFHVTEDALPPRDWGTLDPNAVQDHFRAFYRLYGIHNPNETQLPKNPERIEGLDDLIARVVSAARDDADPEAIDVLARIAEPLKTAARTGAKTVEAKEALVLIDRYHCLAGKGSFG